MQHPYIAAWNYLSGSHPYYVRGLQEQAEKEGAPRDAVFKDANTGKWFRAKDVKNKEYMARVEEWVRKFG